MEIDQFSNSLAADNQLFGKTMAISGSRVVIGQDDTGATAGAAFTYDLNRYPLQSIVDLYDRGMMRLLKVPQLLATQLAFAHWLPARLVGR